MNKKGVSLGGLVFLFVVVMFCVVGIGYNETGEAIDLDKTLNWSNYSVSFENHLDAGPIERIVYKIVDAYGYITMELSKIAADLAIKHPEINFRLIIKLLIWGLILFILVPLIKLLVILFILVKDGFAHMKEKREIRRLRRHEKNK